MGLGPGEIAAIVAVGLLLFGAKRLPELARGMGQSIWEFRRSLQAPTGDNTAREGEPPSDGSGNA